jgi:DNA-binding beta-propeller fold protein YncE
MDVGIMLADPDGPHGLAVSPDGKHLYISTAHGTPYGFLWKYSVASLGYVEKVQLGNFPASAQVSADNALVVVVNFNLHGEMVPSDLSIVRASDMLEIGRIRTCTMPHGSRMAGTKHYSTCMMDDQLVETDVSELRVTRHFLLTKGAEKGMTGTPPLRGAHAGHDMSGHGMTAPAAGSTTCSPTWAHPSTDGKTVWVACNAMSDIVEIDATTWSLRRRIPAGSGVYNLAVTRNGEKLIATNKRGQSVSVFDAKSGRELARLPTLRRVVHGIAISHDDRYAFISVEGVGSEPGTVEIIDLTLLKTIARVDVGQMAGGIDVVPPG